MHILIVEDEQRLARLVARVLGEERHVVDIANDGDTGMDLALRGTYDLLILDLMLPGRSGLDICKQVRTHKLQPAILMLTARGSIEDRVAGLRIGADDYLVKPFAMEELVARVDALLRRGRAISDTQRLQVGDLTLDLLRREAQRDGRIIELTAKEFALLEYLMRHPGQVLTRTQIIDHVWRYDSDALSNVVDIYIHYLRDKIDRGSARPMIKTMRGVGYRIEPS
jgi:DNA-binding response OmpR family regulator